MSSCEVVMTPKKAMDMLERRKEDVSMLAHITEPCATTPRTPAKIKEYEQELIGTVREAGCTGITVQEIATKMNSTRKYAYRVQE